MKLSKSFFFTQKDTPREAEIKSHALMLRAGLISKLGSGIYTILPMGLRVLRKIETIIREELHKIDAVEMLMPVLQPKELWEASNRWDEMGELMWKLKDRGNREYCLGPTHEEVITEVFNKNVNSYKSLPLSLYQIQLKYRDEIRPRFGVMRSREFLMKDAYSFHLNKKCLEEVYYKFHEAYSNIFRRCGLKFRNVEADSGNIGGKVSHEFMVLAGTGEDEIAYCPQCNYASNIEKAKALWPSRIKKDVRSNEEVKTEGIKTIKELGKFFNAHPSNFIKSVIYIDDKNLCYQILVRGDIEVNETKLNHYIQGSKWRLADSEEVKEKFKCEQGYISPDKREGIIRIVDKSLKDEENMITGAGRDNYHITGVNTSDLEIDKFVDINKVDEGFKCFKCRDYIKLERGIEVGHIFQLEDKYSKTSSTKVIDESGKEKYVQMGCYGIGVSRIIAACIEQNWDERGIIWPKPLAPFHINIIPVDIKKNELFLYGKKLYETLKKEGFEVLFDDRKHSAGFKFKDSDLLGIPYKIIIGKNFTKENKLEIEKRTGEKIEINKESVVNYFKENLS
ncbi:MAG: proline--tRNA ligase [Candidatus Muiribacteriota bacterium]